MSHSRIIQLKQKRVTAQNRHRFVTADDFVQNNCFIGPIADCISDDCDRREDFDSLINGLKNVIGTEYEKYISWHYADDDTDIPEAYIIFHCGFKKAYMQKRFDDFIKRAGAMTLDNFMSPDYIGQLEEAICDKFDVYITEDAYTMKPLDKFIRSIPNDQECKYWIWATVDYHY